jgi:long-chain acyl-CoA synthetase
MEPRTLNDVFFAIAGRESECVMLARVEKRWKSITAEGLYRNVAGMSRAMRRWGIDKGDRVAILSENRFEWAVADFASLLIGAVVVPIYSTLTVEQTEFILRDSGARVVVVSSAQQLHKLSSTRSRTYERVVVMDPVESSHAFQMETCMREGPQQRDPELEALAREVGPDDLASIIYTSGTTGTSKGVQLTHGNLTSNVLCSMDGFDVRGEHISVSFLPLSHVTARHADLALLYRGVALAYCPFFEDLPQVLQEVRPTVFVAVPRVYEKIHNQVAQIVKGRAKRAVYRWALATGRKHRAEVLVGETPRAFRWQLADRLVYSQVRERLGGRVQHFVSGGAPLGKELAEWYASIGIRIHEGYGLTETSPVIAINSPQAHRLGTVGRPLLNVQIRIAEDGEILVRGPSVFRAYWNRPQETKEAFVDGWFKTGDIGLVDEDGFLCVTDRKKDLLKTSGGKFIAPQPVENSLKLSALVGTAVVLGDRRKFPSVLISPHFPLLEEWARENSVAFSSKEGLIAHPRVQNLYEEIVGEVNRGLARYEKLKKILLVPDEFSQSDGSLTPTLKLRRKIIEERYRRQIDEMYDRADITLIPDDASARRLQRVI